MNLRIDMSRLKIRESFIVLSFIMVVLTSAAQEQETGTVIFFRKLRTTGLVDGFKMYYNNSVYVGNIKNGRYIVFQCPAGTARFSERKDAKKPLEMVVEPGKTYYMECTLFTTRIGALPNTSKYFGPVDNEKGERVVQRLKESKPDEPDRDEN